MAWKWAGACLVTVIAGCSAPPSVPASAPAASGDAVTAPSSAPATASAAPARPPPDELGDSAERSGDVVAAPSADLDAGDALRTCRHGAASASIPPAPPAPKKRIWSGPPITNHVPAELIMRVIRTRTACLRRCYEQGLGKVPDLAGRLAVRFVIDLDGWVRKADEAPGSELHAPDVVACVLDEVRGLRFPEPEGETVTVVYPFVFAPH